MFSRHKDTISHLLQEIESAYQQAEYEKINDLLDKRNNLVASIIQNVKTSDIPGLLGFMEEIKIFDDAMRNTINSDMNDIAQHFKAKNQLKAYHR